MAEKEDFSIKQYFIPLTTVKTIHFIVIIGLIVYFYSLFNGFVWDDMPFIIDNPQVHQFDILSLLGQNKFNNAPYYRPIQAIYFATLYSFFGQQAFFYHVLQLILHLVCTSVLFLFFKRFFSIGISFFLALIFLVHPIQVESVAWISATNIPLYFLPGITALLLAQKQHISRTRFFLITGLLIVSVLVRESGVLFLPLLLMMKYLFRLGKLKQFSVIILLILFGYFLLRVIIGGVIYDIFKTIPPIADLPLFNRILNIPAIVMYYIKTFFIPLHLAIMQNWIVKSLTLENFVIPLLLSSTFFITLMCIAFFLWKKDTRKYPEASTFKQFFFFLFWFVLGLGLLLQLVPLDMTVADRWFYFPIVGVLGMVGIGLRSFQSLYRKPKGVYVTFAIILISLFSFRTFVRTIDWKDNLTLYSHDAQLESNFLLENNYGRALFKAKRYEEAKMHLEKSVALGGLNSYLTWNNIGIVYQYYAFSGKGQMYLKKAENAYLTAIKRNRRYFKVVKNLALFYYFNADPKKTENFVNKSLKEFPQNPELWMIKALVEDNKLNKHDAAIESAKTAFNLSHDKKSYQLYQYLQAGKKYDIYQEDIFLSEL